MATSKFGRAPPARKVPAICKAIHNPCADVLAPIRPPILTAWAWWQDLDPGKEADITIVTEIRPDDPRDNYHGQDTRGGATLEIDLNKLPGLHLWSVTLTIWDPWRNPETYTWSPVHIDEQWDFATPLFQDLVIPGMDERRCRITL